jgi:hypothetical protein
MHSIVHYIYLESRDSAAGIAGQLAGLGCRVEERASADGVHWLVLARQVCTLTEERILSLRESMEGIAGAVGGEYDGWEIEPGPVGVSDS